MGKKRNFKILTKFDYQFKKQNLTLWCGKEEVKKISWFKKGETVTFRKAEISETKNTMDKKVKINTGAEKTDVTQNKAFSDMAMDSFE